MHQVSIEPDFESWRVAARQLLEGRVPPREVWWTEADAAQAVLPDLAAAAPAVAEGSAHVPRKFVTRGRLAALHADTGRWDLLYRLLWRITHESRALLSMPLDPDVLRLEALARQVRKDEHRMRAFVRFREVKDGEGSWFVAWYRPDHRILRHAVPFFVDRFRTMRWAILTPGESAYWDGASVRFGPGAARETAPSDDELEELWRTYYSAAFNPARANPALMRRDMPLRFWRELPETSRVAALLNDAPRRVAGMLSRQPIRSARLFVPTGGDLHALRQAAAGCAGCSLCDSATQTVFGEGSPNAKLMLVGEQPGDREDVKGRPFVGPAGELLDRALAAAGIRRDAAYLTNAVKHFAWEPRGKRRIHRTPRLSEIQACRPWLEAEMATIQPTVIVCLGATAALALLGPQFRLMQQRGRVLRTPWAPALVATVHPAAVLRGVDDEVRNELYRLLVADLRTAAQAIAAAVV